MKQRTNQLGFYIEQENCSGCKACQIACKDRANLDPGHLMREVHEYSEGEYTVKNGTITAENVTIFNTTMACNHCAVPACIDACPAGAITKDLINGVVITDQEKCQGCGTCIEVCPYDAPTLVEEEGVTYKCDFCIDQIEEGRDPQCVGACPTRALHYGKIDELREKYGDVNQTKGMPDPVTEPCIVIKPAKNAL